METVNQVSDQILKDSANVPVLTKQQQWMQKVSMMNRHERRGNGIILNRPHSKGLLRPVNADSTPIAAKLYDLSNVSRNSTCPCGSFRRFKRCCGRPEPTSFKVDGHRFQLQRASTNYDAMRSYLDARVTSSLNACAKETTE